MNIVFITYGWEWVELVRDSNLRLIYALKKRGHQINLVEKENIKGSHVINTKQLNATNFDDVESFFHSIVFKDEMINLRMTNLIIFADVPPLSKEILHFLEEIERYTPFFNRVKGLWKVRNKNYIEVFDSYDWIPETYYINEVDTIRDKLEDQDWILKPIQGYKGLGVEFVSKKECGVLEDLYPNATYVLQEFLPEVKKGCVRVMQLDGDIIGSFNRIPYRGDFKAVVSDEGQYVRHELTEKQRIICKILEPELKRDGLYLTGLDFIGDKLIEVNGLAPGGFARINRLYNKNVEEIVADFIENKWRV